MDDSTIKKIMSVYFSSMLLWALIRSISYKANFTEQIYQGKVVYQIDNPDMIGLVMEVVGDDVLIWWQNWIEYDPFNKDLTVNGKYFYKTKSLVVTNDSSLNSPIYRRPNNFVPESMVIGKHVCFTLSTCQECYVIKLYWKQYWLLENPSTGSGIYCVHNFSQHQLYGCKNNFHPDDPCFRDHTADNPRRCVIKNCCKIAIEDTIPSYCHC